MSKASKLIDMCEGSIKVGKVYLIDWDGPNVVKVFNIDKKSGDIKIKRFEGSKIINDTISGKYSQEVFDSAIDNLKRAKDSVIADLKPIVDKCWQKLAN